MPRKQPIQFTAAGSVVASDVLVIQPGTVGAAIAHATATQFLNAGIATTAESVTVTGTAIPANGIYRPATNTVGIAVNSTLEAQLTTSAFSPGASDGNALGTTALMWSDLFLASGAVVNFNNGNVTVTHSAGTLSLSGALAMTGNVIKSRGTAITAAGTSQATATALTAQINIVTTVSAGQGVVLADQDATVLNRGTVDLLVYPPSGAQIEAYGTNTAVALPVNGSGNFVRSSSTLFRVF